MSLLTVTPSLTRKISTPVKNNLLHKLKVPVLAATMIAGSAIAAKAQTKPPVNDTIKQPLVTVTIDTIGDKKDLIQFNEALFEANDSISELINKSSMGLNAAGSAAEELYLKILANISESGENPYSAIYLALSKQDKTQIDSSYDVSNQLEDVVENMKVYARDQKEDADKLMEQNGSISEFHYGKDNSKTGVIIQTLNITGLNLNDNDKTDTSNDTVSKNNNEFAGNVAYRVKAITEKVEAEANINAGSENVDIQFATMYKTKTSNDGNLALSINGRETIDGTSTHGSAGASIDYLKNNFSTGMYYYYNRETDEEGTTNKDTELEGYLKYKNNIKLNAGIQTQDDYGKYYYTGLKLSGAKKLEDINLKLSGALSAEVGSLQMDLRKFDLDNTKTTNLDFDVIGGAYFKTDDMKASLNARASYNYMIDPDGDNSSNIGISALGAFSKGSVAVTAMVSMFKDLYTPSQNAAKASDDNDVSISTSVGLEIKDLLKGISPQLSYTSTSINNKVQHFFNVTLKTSIEALRKNNRK